MYQSLTAFEDGFERGDIFVSYWFDATLQPLEDASIILVRQQSALVQITHETDGFGRITSDDM